ncbi:hypothetical protein [Rhizobium sp.]
MRKAAGTETLPFASILFVALDRNRDMTRDFRFPQNGAHNRHRYATKDTEQPISPSRLGARLNQPDGPAFT